MTSRYAVGGEAATPRLLVWTSTVRVRGSFYGFILAASIGKHDILGKFKQKRRSIRLTFFTSSPCT